MTNEHKHFRCPQVGCSLSPRIVGLLAIAFLVAAWAPPSMAQTPPACKSDLGGIDQSAGGAGDQGDLTQFCLAPGNGAPYEFTASWSWDETSFGSQTGDACLLYDTDNDGFVNLATCVTVTDGGQLVGKARLYTCTDTRPENCTGGIQINVCQGQGGSPQTCLTNADCTGGGTCPASYNTTCSVSIQPTDPFKTSPQQGDTVATCSVDFADFGAAGNNATLLDSCAYTSSSPTSNARDCILFKECTTTTDCNDSNTCTVDSCNTTTHTCRYDPAPNTGSTCTDQLFCTVATTCNSSGFCGGGSVKDCSDSNGCTSDSCDETADACVNNATAANGSACGDTGSGACDQPDSCLAGVCAPNHLQAGSSCGDGSSGPCDAADSCDGAGACQTNHVGDGTFCGDAGAVCTNQDTCLAGACHDNGFKSDTISCTGVSQGGACDGADHCSGTSGACVDAFLSAATTCRAVNGQCDAAETCSGASGACPADGFASDATSCTGTSQDGACDGADHCAGTSNSCVEVFLPSSSTCRGVNGQCDVAESCSGASGACPADGFASDTTSCTGASQDGACDGADHCAGSSNSCVDVYLPSSTTCRATDGQCDAAETCTGASGACPANGFALDTTSCTGVSQGGACDLDSADRCAGTANSCVDAFLPSTETCRAVDGQCDVAESCTGTSGACPADSFASSATGCTGTSQDGACDGADHCAGASNSCVEVFLPSATTCRATNGQCDAPETCTGTSGACPADGFASDATSCTGTSQGGACDGADHCAGTSDSCVEVFLLSATTCRTANGQCDAPETCTGTSGACPAEGFASDTTPCTGTSQGGRCDGADHCAGTSNSCVDVFLLSTTTCRASYGPCDAAETCDGTSGACPANGFAPNTTSCTGTSQGGACDGADRCAGTANSCVDVFLPSTTTCRGASGQCDAAETCTGTSGACPANGFASNTTSCTGTSQGGACDGADHCEGTSNSCVEVFRPSATTCRAPNGSCDVAETCSGSSGACPADAFKGAGSTCGDPSSNVCTDPDTCNASGVCLPNNKPCSYVTDSNLCTFDHDSVLAGRQFNAIFTPDVQIWPGYKLNASNPGQYYYNALVTGTAASAGSVTLEIPWPFVTQGANPVHLYDGDRIGINGSLCFRDGSQLPANGESFPATITVGDRASGVHKQGGVGSAGDAYDVFCPTTSGDFRNGLPGYNCEVSVAFRFPSSGKVYVNIHLDYGVKGLRTDLNPVDTLADRYDRGANSCTGAAPYYDALKNDTNSTPAGPLALATCTAYDFSHSGSGTGNDSVQNVNTFKKIVGVFGRAGRSADGSAIAGWNAILVRNSTGAVVATGVTDRDGFYGLNYKHTGKQEPYTVTLGTGSSAVSKVISLKANGWADATYDASTNTWNSEVVGN